MKKESPKFRKVTINIPVRIYQELEKRFEENGTNITTEIIALIREGLKQDKAIDYMPHLLEAYLNERKGTKNPKK